MVIRKLTPADSTIFRAFRSEMCRLHPEAFGDTPEEVAAVSEETLCLWVTPCDTFPQKFVLGAFDDDSQGAPRLLSTVAFRREDQFKERHRALIWSVYTRAEAQGRGLSRLLMERVIAEARMMDGLEQLFLTVAAPQTAARTLYTSLGFITYGLFRDGYKLADNRYVDHEYMVLSL